MSEISLEDLIGQLKSPDANVRRNSAWLMGRFRDSRVIEPLVACLRDPDATVRARATESLGTRREPEVVPPLLSCLQDEDATVRQLASRSLGFIGNISARDALIDSLKDNRDAVRSQSAESLGLLAEADTITADELALAVKPLCESLLRDEDSSTRHYASFALEAIGSPTVDDTLLQMLQPSLDVAPLIDLLELMGKIASLAFRDALADYLNYEDDDVQATAEWALSRINAHNARDNE